MKYRREQTGDEASCYCCKDVKSSECPMGWNLVDYRVLYSSTVHSEVYVVVLLAPVNMKYSSQ